MKKAQAYIDGSFKPATNCFTCGIYFRDLNSGLEMSFSYKYNDIEGAKMGNVAGEIMGAVNAMLISKKLEIDELDLFYDYNGIAEGALGKGKVKNPYIKLYKDFYDDISKNIKINFIKIKSHSGNFYNTKVDKLATEAHFRQDVSEIPISFERGG